MKNDLIDDLLDIVSTAHEEILDVYQTGFKVDRKSDASPITEADRRAHDVILSGLQRLSECWPVVSEESAIPPYAERKNWERYWLVDPLDGTKEFVKRNGEFTVNIALIENGKSILGVVGRPTTEAIYWGDVQAGLAKRVSPTETVSIKTRAVNSQQLASVQSRRRPDPRSEQFLEKIESEFGQLVKTHRGSSLKFLAIAKGEVDLYLQPGGTSEWDTAAAHAVLEAAGGQVMTFDGESMRYNKGASLANEPFIAIGDHTPEWRKYLVDQLQIFLT